MSKLTLVGITEEQFLGYMCRKYNDDVVLRATSYIQDCDSECNIVVLIPNYILEHCNMFTNEQITNICNDIADTFELDRLEWFVFTCS